MAKDTNNYMLIFFNNLVCVIKSHLIEWQIIYINLKGFFLHFLPSSVQKMKIQVEMELFTLNAIESKFT